MKKAKYIITITLMIFAYSTKAQYIQFSQYYSAPMVLAPSFAGAAQKSRVHFNYRDQWGRIPQSIFVTYAAGFDMHVPKINSGFGVLAIRDQAGAGNLARTEVGVLYSWYALLSKNRSIYFRPGIQFKLSQRSIDFPKLIFGNQINPDGSISPHQTQVPPTDFKKLFVDATSSLLFYSPEFWVGYTADHLFRPGGAFYEVDDYKVPIKHSVFGGYKFRLNSKTHRYASSSKVDDWLFLSAYYRLQSKSDQLDLGGYWGHDPFMLGVWVRGLPYLNVANTLNIDAIIFLVSYKIYNFQVGYSYDFTVSQLLAFSGGSHEISLSYLFNTNLRSRKKNGPMPCPRL